MRSTISLKDNRTFRRMYSSKKGAVCPFFVLYSKKNNMPHNRLGLTVSVKLGGAVLRNRIKRRLKEVYRLNESSLKSSHDIVIVARNRAKDAPFTSMEHAFLKCCSNLNILKTPSDN